MNGKIIPAPGDKLNAIPSGMAGKDNATEIPQQLIILLQPIGLQYRCRIHEPLVLGNGLHCVRDLVKRVFALRIATV